MLFCAAGYCAGDALLSCGFRHSIFSDIIRCRSNIPYGQLDDLRRLADDAKERRDRRSAAILSLFAHHIDCGMSGGDIQEVLGAASWLRESTVTEPMVLTGRIPVQTSGRTVVVIDVLPTDRQGKSWQIWLSLEGDGEMGAGGLDFLTNRGASGRFILAEYALCYPDVYKGNIAGRTEHFTRWRFWADPSDTL